MLLIALIKLAIAILVYPFATIMWLASKMEEDSPNTVASKILGTWDLPEPPPGESLSEKIDKWAEDAEFPRLG